MLYVPTYSPKKISMKLSVRPRLTWAGAEEVSHLLHSISLRSDDRNSCVNLNLGSSGAKERFKMNLKRVLYRARSSEVKGGQH